MAFWNKKIISTSVVNSEEYEKLTKKIIDLREIYEELLIKVKKIETDIANLRGRFNQRLSGKKEELQDEEMSSNEKSINNPVILPFNGHTFNR